MGYKKFFAIGFCFSVMLTAVSCSKSADGNGGGGGGGGSMTVTINIPGMSFNPSTASVKVGTIVKWTNNDDVAHTATSDDGTTFNTGRIAPGGSATYTATTAGTFPYHCNLHAGMT
ncbi:MAG: cupredoxin domain-containing protein, partial [Chitinophagaceae bacterium]|nr:cupredoxin domain-containing protein [Chitinophagaceae bacterium]